MDDGTHVTHGILVPGLLKTPTSALVRAHAKVGPIYSLRIVPISLYYKLWSF